MSENTEEPHPANHINMQAENAAADMIAGSSTETISTTQAAENMEVHHHAHHGGKKNWKSYIWEFVMLFLAVFCGFLAEWRLEQMIEHHREEEYIHSMVEDIQADVDQTNLLITQVEGRIGIVDSLLTALSSEGIQQNSNKAYEWWMKSIGFPDFVQNDRTIQQLKSSGALRIIRNRAVSDRIMEYDQAVRQIAVTQNNMNTVAANSTLFNQTFNFIQLAQKTGAPVPLTDGGKKMLNEAYANRAFWKFNLAGLRQRLAVLNKKGKDTAAFIKSQYGLQ